MIGLVTELARQQVAAQEEEARRHEALKGRRYREVPDGEGGTRFVPARLGTSPLHAANDPDTGDETDGRVENEALKSAPPLGSSHLHATVTMEGHGPLAEALAGHVYAMQRRAVMPAPLADLQTTAAPSPSGPTFAPGMATVQSQNHRAATGPFPQAHAPGQGPFHTAPLAPTLTSPNPGSH